MAWQRLDVAREVAVEAGSELKWKQLGEAAMRRCNFELAEECLEHAKDYSGMLMFFRCGWLCWHPVQCAVMGWLSMLHAVCFRFPGFFCPYRCYTLQSCFLRVCMHARFDPFACDGLIVHSAAGKSDKIRHLANVTRAAGINNIAFVCAFLLVSARSGVGLARVMPQCCAAALFLVYLIHNDLCFLLLCGVPAHLWPCFCFFLLACTWYFLFSFL